MEEAPVMFWGICQRDGSGGSMSRDAHFITTGHSTRRLGNAPVAGPQESLALLSR
jgi:hypothetical protein